MTDQLSQMFEDLQDQALADQGAVADTDPDEMTAADIEQQEYHEWKRDMYADVDKGFYE